MIENYEMLLSDNHQTLCNMVNSSIKAGFQPHGGPFIHKGLISQAIVKIDMSQPNQVAADVHELRRAVNRI